VESRDQKSLAIIGTIMPGGFASPGVTDSESSRIVMLDPKQSYGNLPGSVMADGRDNAIDFATALGHEFGHLAFGWGLAVGPSRDAAVGLENQVRRLKDPNGPTRIRHNPDDPEIGKGGFVIHCPGCKP
jgi:hypothetical protein